MFKYLFLIACLWFSGQSYSQENDDFEITIYYYRTYQEFELESFIEVKSVDNKIEAIYSVIPYKSWSVEIHPITIEEFLSYDNLGEHITTTELEDPPYFNQPYIYLEIKKDGKTKRICMIKQFLSEKLKTSINEIEWEVNEQTYRSVNSEEREIVIPGSNDGGKTFYPIYMERDSEDS